MEWLEHNILAYRVMAEILAELRVHIRSTLRDHHKGDDYTAGIPSEIMTRLVKTKEDEQAIDWYESEYRELLDYAVFTDFIEIIEHDVEPFKNLVALAPSSALLHTRFLELEVMRAKLGTARPISEGEMSFLGSFHLRLRRALHDGAEGAKPKIVTPESAPEDAATEPPREEQAGSAPEPEGPTETAATIDMKPESTAAAADADAGVAQEHLEIDEPGSDQKSSETSNPDEASEKAPKIEDAEDSSPRPPRRAAKAMNGRSRPAVFDEGPSDTKSLREALENGDTRYILKELYREITGMAEEMWTDSPPTTPSVWDRIRINTWYEIQFSKIGLKPVSDFYEVISAFNERLEEGISTQEVQDFLKERNFAQILLSLRDMFQKQHM